MALGRLLVNENEAQTVRRIFDVYLQRQSLLDTVRELNRQGITTKRWTTRKGVERGGGPWDKAKLAYTLGNWTFAGKVERIRGIGSDPALLTEVLKKTRADLQDRVDGLDRERRDAERNLRRCATEVKRLVGASQTSATTARLANLQDRITAGEHRIAEIRREVGALEQDRALPRFCWPWTFAGSGRQSPDRDHVDSIWPTIGVSPSGDHRQR